MHLKRFKCNLLIFKDTCIKSSNLTIRQVPSSHTLLKRVGYNAIITTRRYSGLEALERKTVNDKLEKTVSTWSAPFFLLQ